MRRLAILWREHAYNREPGRLTVVGVVLFGWVGAAPQRPRRSLRTLALSWRVVEQRHRQRAAPTAQARGSRQRILSFDKVFQPHNRFRFVREDSGRYRGFVQCDEKIGHDLGEL